MLPCPSAHSLYADVAWLIVCMLMCLMLPQAHRLAKKDRMRCLAVHDYLKIFATAADNDVVTVC